MSGPWKRHKGQFYDAFRHGRDKPGQDGEGLSAPEWRLMQEGANTVGRIV